MCTALHCTALHEVQPLQYCPVVQVESLLKLHPVVENLCLYADPSRTFPVALLIPAQGWLDQVQHDGELLASGPHGPRACRCVPSWARPAWSGRRRAWTLTWWRTSRPPWPSMGQPRGWRSLRSLGRCVWWRSRGLRSLVGREGRFGNMANSRGINLGEPSLWYRYSI